ncbi:hypothetical protein EDD11_002957 [Mortierella claussenii]|nr:hypothetical protein EDD11_002957 [Mortierella claussenii]
MASVANGDGQDDEEDDDEDEDEHSEADHGIENKPEKFKDNNNLTATKVQASSSSARATELAAQHLEDGDLSLSSDNDDDEEDATAAQVNDEEYSNLPEETVCRWKDCGKILPSLAQLVIHLSDEHIGWKKTAYTCEWQGCSRRPIAQTTRFALISHMRSHTKHKPYDCPVPECDKSFSRSDAMAKHLKCQHGDVPERFTGRKSRGRYTMKDPAASSTLLSYSSSGAKKRRHPDSARSDAELIPSGSSRLMSPTKLRKLGNERFGDHRHYHRKYADSLLLHQLDQQHQPSKRGGNGRHIGVRHHKLRRGLHDDLVAAHGIHLDEEDVAEQEENDEDDDVEDSDFEVDSGQTPRQRYGLMKAKFEYIHNERELLENEYEDLKKKLTRLRVERELLLDALLVAQPEYQDSTMQDIDDSD